MFFLLWIKAVCFLLTVPGKEGLVPGLTPGETAQLSKGERGRELQRGEAHGISCWQQISAVRSALGMPILMDDPFRVVCMRYVVDTKALSSV